MFLKSDKTTSKFFIFLGQFFKGNQNYSKLFSLPEDFIKRQRSEGQTTPSLHKCSKLPAPKESRARAHSYTHS